MYSFAWSKLMSFQSEICTGVMRYHSLGNHARWFRQLHGTCLFYHTKYCVGHQASSECGRYDFVLLNLNHHLITTHRLADPLRCWTVFLLSIFSYPLRKEFIDLEGWCLPYYVSCCISLHNLMLERRLPHVWRVSEKRARMSSVFYPHEEKGRLFMFSITSIYMNYCQCTAENESINAYLYRSSDVCMRWMFILAHTRNSQLRGLDGLWPAIVDVECFTLAWMYLEATKVSRSSPLRWSESNSCCAYNFRAIVSALHICLYS